MSLTDAFLLGIALAIVVVCFMLGMILATLQAIHRTLLDRRSGDVRPPTRLRRI